MSYRDIKRFFRRMKARRRINPQAVSAVCIFLALSLSFQIYAAAKLRPVVIDMAENVVIGAVMGKINEKLTELTALAGITYGDIVTVKTDDSGNVTALTTDPAMMTYIQNSVGLRAVNEAASSITTKLKIPLGSVLGCTAFSGAGPNITVRILSVTNASSTLKNEFSSAGINQTCHRIVLNISVEIDILIPGKKLRSSGETSLTVAETVIVGRVPQTILDCTQ